LIHIKRLHALLQPDQGQTLEPSEPAVDTMSDLETFFEQRSR
jgi:hypothetical protein